MTHNRITFENVYTINIKNVLKSFMQAMFILLLLLLLKDQPRKEWEHIEYIRVQKEKQASKHASQEAEHWLNI